MDGGVHWEAGSSQGTHHGLSQTDTCNYLFRDIVERIRLAKRFDYGFLSVSKVYPRIVMANLDISRLLSASTAI